MKKSNTVFLLAASLLAGAALACSVGGGGTPTAPAGATVPAGATEPASAVVPTVAATAEAQTTAAAEATGTATQGPVSPAAGYSLAATAPEGAPERFGLYASLVLEAQDTPIIAYVSSDPNGDGDPNDSVLQVMLWSRAGGVWRGPLNVASVGETQPRFYAFQISLARDASTGELGLAYVANNSGELWLAHSSDSGGTWTTEQITTPGDTHEFIGPVLALANGATYLAVADAANGGLYLTRDSGSGDFTITPLPLLEGTASIRFGQTGLALDSAGRPGLAYWLEPNDGNNLQLAFWRPGDAAATKITDTNNMQNDNSFVTLAYNGDKPTVAIAVMRGIDPNTNDFTGTIWTVNSEDGTAWSEVIKVPPDGGQSMDAPLSLAISSQGQAALTARVTGGNMDGTQCGRPKLARSSDLTSWRTCSPDPSQDTSLNEGYVRAAFGSDGKLVLVIQNTVSDALPAGVLYWREP